MGKKDIGLRWTAFGWIVTGTGRSIGKPFKTKKSALKYIMDYKMKNR